MAFLYYALFAAAIVVVDQITKFLTVANIALYEGVPFIPGVLQLTYVRNTGAAFSSFEGQQWLFALVLRCSPEGSSMNISRSLCPLPSWSVGASRPSMLAAWAI